MAAKRFTDIEIALRWAYRDELPKRQQSRGSWTAGTTLQQARVVIVRDDYAGSREPGYPAALGEPHPDALAIEAAVKGLAAWAGHGFGPDDAGGLMHGMDYMDVDYMQAGVEAVASMPAIVAVHARAGTRPRWSWELPVPFPDRGGNGKARVLIDEIFVEKYDRKGLYYEPAPDEIPAGAVTYIQPVPCPPIRAGVYREGAYSPLVYRPRPAHVVAERAEYAAWRMGLELLHQALEGRLATVAPLAPAAAWRPWAGQRDSHGRPPELFRALRTEPHRRITREQQAARRRAAQRRQLEVRTESRNETGKFPAMKNNQKG